MASLETRAKDRRVLRTQSLLCDALTALIHEKPYDAIAVSEILDRANVGRSTFYTHFRDKDELLVRCIHEMVRSIPSPTHQSPANRYERIIGFSLPFLRHQGQRQFGGAGMGNRGLAVVHEHLREVLAERVADDIRRELQGRRKTPVQVSPELLAEYVAATFVLVLHWWMGQRGVLPPNDVNDVFRSLVLPTLTAALE